MDILHPTLPLYALGAIALGTLLLKIKTRLELSRAKHRSLTGHVRMGKRVASLIPFYEYDQTRFFSTDDAPDDVTSRRRTGFQRLSQLYRERYSKTARLSAEIRDDISDLRFIDTYRVPFQFSRHVRQNLDKGTFAQASSGVMLTDLDGNRSYDLTGSYGLNVFGYDFYKACIERGQQQVQALGPVLGTYHPAIVYNVKRLKEISGLDEVSFHMSGTEAVMQAVRLARYHTSRTHAVRFAGAYHGWWGDVQPGIGNPSRARETYTLQDMSDATLHVLRTRKDIACVLVNPVQALHPNQSPAGDSSLVDGSRRAHFDRDAYAAWLNQLRAVCTERKIVLILDEVFVGFRLGLRGAQEYFGVRADMVVYGKTLGGGLPVGALCGRKEFMKRFRDDRPGDICFARGTFNSHPLVMGAMHEFLKQTESPAVLDLYDGLDARWNDRADRLNRRLQDENLPVRVANMSTIWTVTYTQPSRYHWMFQFYLRAEGLALSWIGTGRLIFSLNYTDRDFDAVADRFVAAARAMYGDGWWWTNPAMTNKSIKRSILREMLARRFSGDPQRPIDEPVNQPLLPSL